MRFRFEDYLLDADRRELTQHGAPRLRDGGGCHRRGPLRRDGRELLRDPRAQPGRHPLAAAKRLTGADIAIETHHMFWTNNFFMGECAVAEKHAEEAGALYDPDRHHALTYKYSGHDPGVCSQCFSGLPAWQLAGAGQRERAIDTLDQAIARSRQNGSHFLLSEIVRAKAEVLARGKDCDDKEVEALFRSAAEIATKQNAPLPALRAATGWARFLTDRRQGSQARAVLAPYAQLIGGLAGSPDAAAAAELTGEMRRP